MCLSGQHVLSTLHTNEDMTFTSKNVQLVALSFWQIEIVKEETLFQVCSLIRALEIFSFKHQCQLGNGFEIVTTYWHMYDRKLCSVHCAVARLSVRQWMNLNEGPWMGLKLRTVHGDSTVHAVVVRIKQPPRNPQLHTWPHHCTMGIDLANFFLRTSGVQWISIFCQVLLSWLVCHWVFLVCFI